MQCGPALSSGNPVPPWLEQSTEHLFCHTLAICYLQPAVNCMGFWWMSHWLYQVLPQDSCVCFCWSLSGRNRIHILLWSKAGSPGAQTQLPAHRRCSSSPSLNCKYFCPTECGVSRWLRCPQGWVGVYTRESCWEPSDSSLHPPHDNIHVHLVTEVLWTLLVKGFSMEQPHSVLKAKESTALTSPALMAAPSPPPCSSPGPSPAAFPAHPFLSTPMCSATQIKHFFIRLGWPWAGFVAGQGWWRQHLPAWRLSGAACGLSNHAGISSSLQLPLKNAAPRFLFP